MPGSELSTTGVVLIHGGLHTAWCWHRMTPLLDGPWLAPDLLGRGARAMSLTSLKMRHLVDDVVAAMTHTGWESLVVVAHSLGGLTALGLCEVIPERIAHVIFISAVTPKPAACPVDELSAPLRWPAKV